MTEQITSGRLNFEVLRRAVEQSDAGTLISLYAEDVEFHTVKNSTLSIRGTFAGGR